MTMRRSASLGLMMALGFATSGLAQQVRQLSSDEYVDKMKAGWVGQMVGVGWGAPTEFKIRGKIMPV